MFRLSLIIIIIAALVLCAGTIVADISINEEMSFEVANIGSDIDKFEFTDIDADGIPEMLVCDGNRVILHSVTGDSTIFEIALDPEYLADPVNYRLLLADVNHDGKTDVLVGYYYYDALAGPSGQNICKLRMYDAAQNYTAVEPLVFTTGSWLEVGKAGSGFTALEAIDIYGTGQTALVVSYEEITSSFSRQFTSGRTWFYETFPGPSFADEEYFGTYHGATALQPDTNYFLAAMHHKERFIDNERVMKVSYVAPTVIREDGAMWYEFPGDGAGMWFDADSITYYSREIPLCAGDLDTTTAEPEVLSSESWARYCYYGDASPVSGMGAGLTMMRLMDDMTFEPVWTDDGYFRLEFAFDPALPGGCFLLYDNRIERIDGHDGSVIDQSDYLPEGIAYWDRPYGDERLRVVMIDGKDVALYAIDMVTDVNNGEAPPQLPESFVLGQPYPNPFNPDLSIPLTMNRAGQLTVEVFNVAGQKVATLHKGPVSPGEMDLKWHASEHASGLYFITATTSGGSATVKAVLLK